MSEYPDIRHSNRIIGTESENTMLAPYGSVRHLMARLSVPSEDLVQVVYRPLLERLPVEVTEQFDGEIPGESGFTSFGRVYQEIHGGFIESASAESTSAVETIQRQHAGEAYALKVGRFFLWLSQQQELIEEHGLQGLIPPVRHVIKRTLAEDGSTCGMHCNFLGDSHVPLHSVETSGYGPALMSHIVTSLFTFAGGTRQSAASGSEYVAGSKLTTIEKAYGEYTVREKPLVNTRIEHHASAQHYRRLHITSMDGGMWPWPEFMKLTTTSLVLRLAENGIDCSDILLRDPVAAAQTCAMAGIQGPDDINRRIGSLSVDLLDGKAIHPLALQLRLLEKCEKMAEYCYVSPEEAYALDQWGMISEALLKDAAAYYAYVEFIGKLVLGSEAAERRQAGRGPELDLAAYNRAWCNLDPDLSIGIKTREYLAPQRGIMQQTFMPPERTRANARQEALDYARANTGRWPNRDIKFDWRFISAGGAKLFIDDPYADDARSWIEGLKKAA
jgi:proteasome accessory factor A